ncbi:MAG: hypothetical protein AAB092_02705 [Chloroflexota bacterium]
MRLRTLAAFAAGTALAFLLFAPQREASAQTAEGLLLASTVTYDIKTTGDAVHVAWDATLTNNDPESTFQNGQGFYYFAYPIPVLIGAANVQATDNNSVPLDVEVLDVDSPLVQSAKVSFARGIFYGETYKFRLTYDLAGAHSRSTIVTPYYAYLTVVGAGDPATVTVNMPAGEPWSTSLEGSKCPRAESVFTCSGSQGPYVVAVAEASQPSRTASTTFDIPLADKTLNVTLTYFQGDEATAQQQQALIAAGLPVIEETFGFRHPGPTALNIAQGGQQAVLGYEGLTGCDADSCDIVISPVASDYTVLHELAHMWTGIYDKRWLEEGFAELVAETVGPQLPEGVVTGDSPERTPSSIEFQLDTWGPTTSLIGADAGRIALEDAGYDYSLRFLGELRAEFGLQALQAVNRNIATSGRSADSRRFMDVLEEATRRNADNLFLVWVFPESYRTVLADRREAKDRAADLRDRLVEESLPSNVLTPIEALIDQWMFDQALDALDKAEAGLDTYAGLLPRLTALEKSAAAAGLEAPTAIEEALVNFDFESVRQQLTAAGDAVLAYNAASKKVHAGRSLWTKFGLLGSDPGGSLSDAADSFAAGDFETARVQSEHAQYLIADASSVAFRRLLLVAGLLAVLALAVGIAVAVGHFRERELADS